MDDIGLGFFWLAMLLACASFGACTDSLIIKGECDNFGAMTVHQVKYDCHKAEEQKK